MAFYGRGYKDEQEISKKQKHLFLLPIVIITVLMFLFIYRPFIRVIQKNSAVAGDEGPVNEN